MISIVWFCIKIFRKKFLASSRLFTYNAICSIFIVCFSYLLINFLFLFCFHFNFFYMWIQLFRGFYVCFMTCFHKFMEVGIVQIMAKFFWIFLFALSFSPQTINTGQDTLCSESLKSNSAIVPHRLITSAFLKPILSNAEFGIRWNNIFWTFNNFRGILYCAAINTSAFTLSGWSIA